MLKNRFFVLICTVLILLSFSLGTAALPERQSVVIEDTYVTSGENVGGGNPLPDSFEATDSEYRFYVPVYGENPISEEVLYIVKVLSFSAVCDNSRYEFILWVEKSSNKAPRIIVTDESGKLVPDDIAEDSNYRINQANNVTGFEIMIKSGRLIINDYLMLQNMSSIDDVEPCNGIILSGDEKEETSIHQNDESTSEPELLSAKEEKKSGLSKDIKYIIFGILAVVAIIVLTMCIVLLTRKSQTDFLDKNQTYKHKAVDICKPQSSNSPSKGHKDASSIKSEKTHVSNKDIPEARAAESEKNSIGLDELSVGVPKPQESLYVSRIEPRHESKKPETNDVYKSIYAVYSGTVSYDAVKANTLPLFVSNIYDLSINPSEMPKLNISNSRGAADYLLLENGELYINFERFYGSSFKAYSDISGLDKCFNIVSDYGATKPCGQRIVDFKPAKVIRKNNIYTVSEKGTIRVKEN